VVPQIAAPDIATAGTFDVSITNPTPGGGTSENNPAPTITTTAMVPPTSRRRDPYTPSFPWIAITALAGLMSLWLARQQRFVNLRARPAYLALALLLITGAGLVGCTTAQMASTPKGASSVTVTATSAGVAKMTTISINVQ
jgi:hypothetical protein